MRDAVPHRVTDTRRHIKSVLHSGHVQPWAKRCVTECYERYDTAEIFVDSLANKYRLKDFVNADFYDVALINSMGFCLEAFQKDSQNSPVGGCGGGVSPFSARNNNTIQLAGMVQAVISLLRGVLH
nr:putative invertase inhibitor [Ipomoea trifida]